MKKNESKIIISGSEYVGKFPLRQEVTILPPDDPKKLKLGWTIYENHGPYYLPSKDDSCYETDIADKFRCSHGVDVNKPDTIAYHVVPQLQFLWGQPWNNLALDFVMALRPSAIRVTDGCVTADCYHWRVTVYLEKDKRTIKHIDQECQVGTIGAECGHDLYLKFEQQKTGKKITPFDVTCCIINNKAIAKLKVDVEETKNE